MSVAASIGMFPLPGISFQRAIPDPLYNPGGTKLQRLGARRSVFVIRSAAAIYGKDMTYNKRKAHNKVIELILKAPFRGVGIRFATRVVSEFDMVLTIASYWTRP